MLVVKHIWRTLWLSVYNYRIPWLTTISSAIVTDVMVRSNPTGKSMIDRLDWSITLITIWSTTNRSLLTRGWREAIVVYCNNLFCVWSLAIRTETKTGHWPAATTAQQTFIRLLWLVINIIVTSYSRHRDWIHSNLKYKLNCALIIRVMTKLRCLKMSVMLLPFQTIVFLTP